MKQFAIVLEKCFSKCLAGASNADRGNPVYSQDKSAPAWPIHTPSLTAPYIQNTKKTQLKYRKIQKAKIIWLLAPSILNIPCFGSPNLCFIFVIRDVSLYTNSIFFNIVQNAFDPPPPLRFEHLVDFLTDWETLCTALRMDNTRHRFEETMSNIP